MNKQMMTSFGFKYVNTCNCSGTQTEKYFDGRYTVSIMPRRRLFKVHENNRIIIPLTTWTLLENYLKDYASKKTF